MPFLSSCKNNKGGPRQFHVKTYNVDGSRRTLKVDLPPEGTVDDLLLNVMKLAEIPFTAFPYLSICKAKQPATRAHGNKSLGVLDFRLGLPFFKKPGICSHLELQIDTNLLPPEFELAERLLGQRGLVLLVHQAFSILPHAPTAFKANDNIEFCHFSNAVLTGYAFIGNSCCEANRTGDNTNEDCSLISQDCKSSQSRDSRFLEAFHSHMYKHLAPIRTLLRRRNRFVRSLKKSARFFRDESLKVFYDKVQSFDPRPHPLTLLSKILPKESPFDGQVLCAQLDELVWDRISGEVEVTYLKDFSACVTASCRISAAKMALISRFLSLHHPDVICRSKDGALDLTPRMLRFYRTFNVARPVAISKSNFCKRSNEMAQYEISTKERRSCGDFGLVLKHRGRSHSVTEGDQTNNYFSPDLLLLLRCKEKQSPAKRVDLDGFLVHLRREKKPSVARFPAVTNCDDMERDSVRFEGRFSFVQKVKDDKNEVFALKRLKPKDQEVTTSQRWRVHLENAYDFYSPMWQLHPVLGIETGVNGSPMAISAWLELCSLHDVMTSDGSPFFVRHLLQVAMQMGAALAYLETMDVEDVGLHPRNVLVEKFTEDAISVRLSEAGTVWFSNEEETSDPQKWTEEPICLSVIEPNLRCLLKTLYLCIYGYEADHEVESIKSRLWRDLRVNSSSCFHVFAFGRRRLKANGPELNTTLVTCGSHIESPDEMKVLRRPGWIIEKLSESFTSDPNVKTLGTGHSATVYLVPVDINGRKKNVAVKKVKLASIDLEKEAAIHRSLEHRNIVGFLDWSKSRRLLVMAYANSRSLLHHVRSEKDITEADRRDFCVQICQGMHYLHTRANRIIHRDLACRNILLHREEGQPLCVKISDFGLSRDPPEIYESKGIRNTEVPKFWLPPAKQESTITYKVDVWSFGVCCWEIYTRGGNPFNYYKTKSLERDRLPQQYKDFRIPDNVYEVMERCWLEQEKRPCFADLIPLFAPKSDDACIGRQGLT